MNDHQKKFPLNAFHKSLLTSYKNLLIQACSLQQHDMAFTCCTITMANWSWLLVQSDKFTSNSVAAQTSVKLKALEAKACSVHMYALTTLYVALVPHQVTILGVSSNGLDSCILVHHFWYKQQHLKIPLFKQELALQSAKSNASSNTAMSRPRGIQPPKPIMHIAYSPLFQEVYESLFPEIL